MKLVAVWCLVLPLSFLSIFSFLFPLHTELSFSTAELQWVTVAPLLLDGLILSPPTTFSLRPCIMLLSVQFSRSVVSDSLRPHGLQHTRPPCPSPTPGVYSNSCPSSQWCHPTISSSVVPFSSCLQSFPASGSFQMSQVAKVLHQVARVLEFQLQHQSFQWIFRTDFL